MQLDRPSSATTNLNAAPYAAAGGDKPAGGSVRNEASAREEIIALTPPASATANPAAS